MSYPQISRPKITTDMQFAYCINAKTTPPLFLIRKEHKKRDLALKYSNIVRVLENNKRCSNEISWDKQKRGIQVNTNRKTFMHLHTIIEFLRVT